ncbi:MAG: uracil-DNA glycosylase [Acidilobaceae archaeon]|nr:uracil-DNA glycosylase [Acidilobaceae archaeon]
MESLREEIQRCVKCRLHAFRKNAVPGEGPLGARVVLVGEAPGRAEDELGRPFVGPSGRLLEQLLGAAGLRREEVYVTNVVKCRPPGNRRPRGDEVRACLPYLLAELSALSPALVVALGETAGRTLSELLGREWRGVRRSRGIAEGELAGRRLRVAFTYHPAAALWGKGVRALLQEDLRAVAAVARGAPPGDPQSYLQGKDHAKGEGSHKESEGQHC